MGLNLNAILYLTSIPLFVGGLIILIIQAIRKKKKKIPILIIVVSILMCAGGICLPDAEDIAEISSHVSSSNISGEKISRETAENIAKQEIVNLCCDNSGVSAVNITYGTFNVSEYYRGGYQFEAQGTYLPRDDYGMYGDRKKFNIRLVVEDDKKITVLVESYSSAY